MLRAKLQRLPKTLEKTYERILTNIPPDYLAEARAALWCLAFSPRPMTLATLAEAAVINREEKRFDPHERLSNPQDILEICSSLITIYNREDQSKGTSGSKENSQVRLAHYSVYEYLTSDAIQNGLARSFYCSSLDGSRYMAEICIIYLQHPTERDLTRSNYRQLWPFAEFSATYWYGYCQLVLSEVDTIT